MEATWTVPLMCNLKSRYESIQLTEDVVNLTSHMPSLLPEVFRLNYDLIISHINSLYKCELSNYLGSMWNSFKYHIKRKYFSFQEKYTHFLNVLIYIFLLRC